MKKYANQMTPGDVFHPSETIIEEMEAQNIKQMDIVKASGLSRSFISLLLKGERSITIPIALVLEKTLNIPAEFWIRLQKNYELNRDLILLKEEKKVS